ncbi:MAG: recombinase zinc beta ribbon domain-containing protein [Sterolibacteriaceae bacterium]|nr:recombinase zinc beta ribbon domain-containing protein [Sterolibacteriaceae bacterium]
MAHNTNGRGSAVRGSVRSGGALLSGLLRCGHCGAKLIVQYPGPQAFAINARRASSPASIRAASCSVASAPIKWWPSKCSVASNPWDSMPP